MRIKQSLCLCKRTKADIVGLIAGNELLKAQRLHWSRSSLALSLCSTEKQFHWAFCWALQNEITSSIHLGLTSDAVLQINADGAAFNLKNDQATSHFHLVLTCTHFNCSCFPLFTELQNLEVPDWEGQVLFFFSWCGVLCWHPQFCPKLSLCWHPKPTEIRI